MTSKTQRLIDYVIDRVRSGEWPPGHKLPPASQLRELHGISQMTVRMAIERLRADGWVTTVPGAGVWVATDPPE